MDKLNWVPSFVRLFLLVAAAAWLIAHLQTVSARGKACEIAGGLLVRTQEGLVCAKLEILPLKGE